MREMKRILTRYTQILLPWLSVTVYLWLLELQAAFGTDPEPLLDRLADSSAILWTLMLWIAGLSVGAFLISIPFRISTVSKANHLACNAALILITVFHFLRWLDKWKLHDRKVVIIPISLLILCALLSLWAAKKRKGRSDTNSNAVWPRLNDCFYFAAFPVIVVSAVVVAVKITNELTARGSVAHASLSASAETKLKPNVLLIIYDGLRAKNMSVYGHLRETTPHLEKFAERSNLYMQMHANSTTTQPSMTTILSGRHPFSHGRLTREVALYGDSQNIIRVLRDNGYATVAVSSNREASLYSLGFVPYLSRGEHTTFSNLTLSWLRDWGVLPTAMGSRIYENLSMIFPFLGFPRRTSAYGYSDDALDTAKKLLKELRPPFFLLIHLHEPHDPYHASAAFAGLFSHPGTLRVKHRMPSRFYSYYPPEQETTVAHYRDQYDESIRFLDSEF